MSIALIFGRRMILYRVGKKNKKEVSLLGQEDCKAIHSMKYL